MRIRSLMSQYIKQRHIRLQFFVGSVIRGGGKGRYFFINFILHTLMSFAKTYHRICVFSMVNSFDLHLFDIPIDHILPLFALVIPRQ